VETVLFFVSARFVPFAEHQLNCLNSILSSNAAQRLRNRSLRDRFPARRNTEEKHFKSGARLRALFF
jgi:hypothetical protein